MKIIDLREMKAEKNGEVTVKSLVENLYMAVDEGKVKSIVYVALTEDDEIAYGNSSMNQTKTVGLLECGKQMVINDMYD